MNEEDTRLEILLSRARSAAISRDFAVAERLYKEYLSSKPGDVPVLKALGSIYVKSGDDESALPVFKTVLTLKNDDVTALNECGAIYRRRKDYARSVDLLQKAVIADESNLQSFYNLGFTYKSAGKYESAIKAFERVLDFNPEDVLSFNHIGTIYAVQGEYDKALEFYHRGLIIDPNHPVLHLNMAKCYEAMGRTEDAGMEFERALKIKPLWKDATLDYTDYLIQQKRPDDAERIISSLRNARNCGDEVNVRLEKISALRPAPAAEEQTAQIPAEKENPVEDKEKAVPVAEEKDKGEPSLEQGLSSPEPDEEAVRNVFNAGDEEDTEPPEEAYSSDIEVTEEADDDIENAAAEEDDAEAEGESPEDNEDDDEIVLKPYEESPELEMERLTENEIPEDELFTHKLDDEIEADNQTDLDSLVAEEEYDIEDETEEVLPSSGTAGNSLGNLSGRNGGFASGSAGSRGGQTFGSSSMMQDDDVYMEIEDENIDGDAKKGPAPSRTENARRREPFESPVKASGEGNAEEAVKGNEDVALQKAETERAGAEAVPSTGKDEEAKVLNEEPSVKAGTEKATETASEIKEEGGSPALKDLENKESSLGPEAGTVNSPAETVLSGEGSPAKDAEEVIEEEDIKAESEALDKKEAVTAEAKPPLDKAPVQSDEEKKASDAEKILPEKEAGSEAKESGGKDFIEEEEEPLAVGEKPRDKVEDASSGPLLPMHKSLREQGFEEKQALTDPKINDTVNNAIDAVSDKEAAERFRKEVLMFQELSSLSQSLPKDERKNFSESKNNLQLEYVISKLSGKPGLLKASTELRKLLDIEDDETILSREVDVNALAFKVFAQSRELIKNLPDKGVAQALEEQVNHLLAKIFR